MKTNFYKSLKLFMFLLFTALSSSTIVAQAIPPKVIISPIGGSRSPWPDFSYTSHDADDISSVKDNESFILGSLMNSVIRLNHKIPDASLIAVGGKSTPQPILFDSLPTSLVNEWESRVMDLPRVDLTIHLTDFQFEVSIRGLLFST